MEEIASKKQSSIPDITLVSHASLLIEGNEFTLLTDPWIDGPAFLNSWTQYPPPKHDVSDLQHVDAIWITHEHSDHMHPETLTQFDDSIPVYVPELNYQRLADRLHDFGFEEVYSLPTGESYAFSESVSATCFHSESVWNDTILYLDFEGFEILNVNDAGINWDVKDVVGSVDLIAAQFSQGASGYPQTWDHLSESEMVEIMEETNEGLLEMAEQLVELFNPEFYLPFASFFDLYQPNHRKYRDRLVMNSLEDVKSRLNPSDCTVLDMIPGDQWIGSDFERRQNRNRWLQPDVRTEYIESEFSEKRRIPSTFDLSHREFHQYFSSFSGTDYAKDVGDLAIGFNLQGEEPIHARVNFKNGDISYSPIDAEVELEDLEAEHTLRVDCPGWLVQQVIRNELSWDEIHIGYWCDFAREPDEYNLGLWKLLHAPWEVTGNQPTWDEYEPPSALVDMSIADLVEQCDPATEVLEQYGMYCAGCPAGMGEDILEAARLHGLNTAQFNELASELEKTISATQTSSS